MPKKNIELGATANPHLLGRAAGSSLKSLTKRPLGLLSVVALRGRGSVWIVAMSEGEGGVAVRAAYIPGGEFSARMEKAGPRNSKSASPATWARITSHFRTWMRIWAGCASASRYGPRRRYRSPMSRATSTLESQSGSAANRGDGGSGAARPEHSSDLFPHNKA